MLLYNPFLMSVRFLYNSINFKNTARKMSSQARMKMDYEEAVEKLNNLQSNKASVDQIRKEIRAGQKCTNLEDMERYLSRIGVSLDKLDTLSVIHVAGTKGKGSTSAMCESILRSHGYRTGFFSSPHLVAVRERIRLNGRIMEKVPFASYFNRIHDSLLQTRKWDGDMPKYFAFLTVMAFDVFLREKVDVAIIEVGIGGVVDYTNILRNVSVVGITALGIDHTSILGNTLEEIAAAKAGIMKPSCEAFTVQQPEQAMSVLKNFAHKTGCRLNVVPEYGSYNWLGGSAAKLHVDIEAYRTNASLAIQMSHSWLERSTTYQPPNPILARDVSKLKSNYIINAHDDNIFNFAISKNNLTGSIKNSNPKKNITNDDLRSSPIKVGKISISLNNSNAQKQDGCVIDIPIATMHGITSCFWPGRFQKIHSQYADFYLDGAHTEESLEICVDWFQRQTLGRRKVLIFSATGDRNSRVMLSKLQNVYLDKVIFAVQTPHNNVDTKNDSYTVSERDEYYKKCEEHARIWSDLEKKKLIFSKEDVILHRSVFDALIDLKKDFISGKEKPCVLITGSLHLVGAALSILDPNLSNETFCDTL